MLDDGIVKVIAAALASLSAIVVAWLANRKSKQVSQQPELPRPTSHDLESVQHQATRDLIRDVQSEFRSRFDRLDDKIEGDDDMRELILKLDRHRPPRD